MRAVTLSVLFIALLLAPGLAWGAFPAPADDAARPGVVAVLDSGINPYHEAFAAPDGEDAVAWAQRLGLDATPVTLSASGNHSARVQADAHVWDAIEPGRLYAFAGTRVLGVTMGANVVPNGVRILDEGGHGTRVASLVARENPAGLIVAVQVSARICADAATTCLTDPSVGRGMRWAANQTWVDVIGVSLGYPANAPSGATAPYHAETREYLEASRDAHARGKLLVVAAGNDPTPVMLDFFDGPAWFIAVGGANPTHGGQTALSAHLPDVVANYTARVATHTSVDGYARDAGTSFATPIVAATLARAAAQARATLGESEYGARVAAGDVRAALNASARLFQPDAWNPTPLSPDALIGTPGQTPPILHEASAPVVAPAQTGWGYVDGATAADIARRIVERALDVPEEKALVAQARAAHQALREAAWG